MLLMLLLAGLGAACSYTTPTLAPAIPEDAESSQLLAADGTELHAFHGVENRESIPLADIPEITRRAVVAIEDSRFWQHRGVDLRGVIRALRANVEEGEVVEGGSTITQQYVKNALVGSDSTLDRKVREAAIAFQVERNLTKDEILELYLNTVYFGAGAYGIQAAAREFFDIDATQLDLTQSALLAGLIRAPSELDPRKNPDGALQRRNQVLDALDGLGWVDRAELDRARRHPLELRQRAAVERYPAPYFVEEVRRFLLDDSRFGETAEERRDLLFAGGLRIETSLDPAIQRAAETAVDRVLVEPDSDPDAAVVVIDPTTGWVRALVGGRDFFDEGPTSKLNLATQGRRPTGSAFKPLVLAAALDEGMGLDTVYPAPAELTLDTNNGPWEVENYDQAEGGTVDLLDATTFSYNTAFAQLVLDVGPTDATAMAARLGVTSPLLPVPSAVLGANDVSPLDLTAAYATLAADGQRRPPVFVTRVESRDGTVLYRWEDEPEQVIEPEIARHVTWALQNVVGRGTGVNARLGRPVAGKTGTGQEWGDAWFVGYTPQLVTGVWVGFAEGQISMVPPTTRETVTGGSWPARIFQLLMSSALVETPIEQFAPLEGDGTDTDTDTGTVSEDGSGSGASDQDSAETQASVPGVPELVGLPADVAVDRLEREGMVAELVEVPDDQYPRGIVVATEPGAGEQPPAEGPIRVEVANGQPVRRVPAILGEAANRVLPLLDGAGLEVEVVLEADPDPASARANVGRIWKLDPSPGSPVGDQEIITVWVNPASG